jgi:hypothetical protein
MMGPDSPWWDFEECGWCHKQSECAVLYRQTEAGRSWSSVWFACRGCALDAPALISGAGNAQSLKIEAVWFWWSSPVSASEPGPGHSFNTLWPIERKWVQALATDGLPSLTGWAVIREGWRNGITKLS